MKKNKKLGKNTRMELGDAQIENVSGGSGAATAGLVSANVGFEVNPNIETGDIKANINGINIETNTAKVVMTTGGESNTVQNTGSISISR